MLAIDKVAFCDAAKERVAEPPLPQPVQKSSEARDTHGCDNSTGLQNSPRLEQRGGALRLLSEVVDRAEQDDRVGGGVRLGNRACISHLRGEAMLGLGIGHLTRLLDVKIQQVVQMDVVASARPDRGVGAGATSHVDEAGWRRRQEAVEQLEGPRELQARRTLAKETITFKAKLVVCGDWIVNHRGSLAPGRVGIRGPGHPRARRRHRRSARVPVDDAASYVCSPGSA